MDLIAIIFALLFALVLFAADLVLMLAISYGLANLCAYFFSCIGNVEVIVWQMTLILFFSANVVNINLYIWGKLPRGWF